MSDIVGDEACPTCVENGGDRTGNHLMIFSNGNKYCNRCGHKEIVSGQGEDDEVPSNITLEDINGYPTFGIPHKRLKSKVAEFYGVRTSFDGHGEPDGFFYPHYKDGKLSGYKQKTHPTKGFYSVGDCKDGELFGQHRIKPGGKFVVITEGEDDALAIWQCLSEASTIEGWVPPVVSISHGSSSAVKDLARNIEYVNSFDKIIIAFDMDEPGREAVDAVTPLLPPGKVYVASFAKKDASEMVVAGLENELKWDILKHAQRYQPDGLVNGADTWERYKNSTQQDCIPYPEDWKQLNEMTYGFRLGSLITWTAGTGVGKSQIFRELEHHVWENTDYNIGVISLEEDVGESIAGIMSVHSGQRLHLPDCEIDGDRERAIHEELFGGGRWTFYDHFGGMDDSSLFNKIRYLGATGHKVIFLDHLSIIVSEFAADGDERQRIDTVMTKLAKIAKELELAIFLIVHLRKESPGRSFEQGAVPSLDDLRGSGSLKQLSWDVIAASRNQQHYDPYCRNISKLTVLKCRFSGRTGEADHVLFDQDTGRMRSVEKPHNYDPEDKRE